MSRRIIVMAGVGVAAAVAERLHEMDVEEADVREEIRHVLPPYPVQYEGPEPHPFTMERQYHQDQHRPRDLYRKGRR